MRSTLRAPWREARGVRVRGRGSAVSLGPAGPVAEGLEAGNEAGHEGERGAEVGVPERVRVAWGAGKKGGGDGGGQGILRPGKGAQVHPGDGAVGQAGGAATGPASAPGPASAAGRPKSAVKKTTARKASRRHVAVVAPEPGAAQGAREEEEVRRPRGVAWADSGASRRAMAALVRSVSQSASRAFDRANKSMAATLLRDLEAIGMEVSGCC